MIDKKQFAELRKEVESFDNQREKIIIDARKIIHLSKQVIYACHRDDFKDASAKLRSMKNAVSDLRELANRNPKLESVGAYKVAIQEYVEALVYYEFVKEGRLPSCKSLRIDPEYYLLGLCDFASELVRRAAQLIIRGKMDEVRDIENFVSGLQGEFLKFDLRNGELRKKADAVRWSLKQLEDLIFQAEMKGRVGGLKL